MIAYRVALLTDYQDAAYAKRYEDAVRKLATLEGERAPGRTALAMAAAKGLYKLMAYKDEYEVGRFYASPEFKAALGEQFASHGRLQFHLAPPLLARRDKTTGEPRKITFGGWMLPVFGMLAKGKRWRGTALDIFGLTAERRLERKMIGDYEVLLGVIGQKLTPANHGIAVQLAANALDVKGFGPIKLRNYELAKKREAQLLAQLLNPSSAPVLRAAE